MSKENPLSGDQLFHMILWPTVLFVLFVGIVAVCAMLRAWDAVYVNAGYTRGVLPGSGQIWWVRPDGWKNEDRHTPGSITLQHVFVMDDGEESDEKLSGSNEGARYAPPTFRPHDLNALGAI